MKISNKLNSYLVEVRENKEDKNVKEFKTPILSNLDVPFDKSIQNIENTQLELLAPENAPPYFGFKNLVLLMRDLASWAPPPFGPAVDVLSAGVNLASGNYIAGIVDIISIVPGAGDVVAQPLRLLLRGKKITRESAELIATYLPQAKALMNNAINTLKEKILNWQKTYVGEKLLGNNVKTYLNELEGFSKKVSQSFDDVHIRIAKFLKNKITLKLGPGNAKAASKLGEIAKEQKKVDGFIANLVNINNPGQNLNKLTGSTKTVSPMGIDGSVFETQVGASRVLWQTIDDQVVVLGKFCKKHIRDGGAKNSKDGQTSLIIEAINMYKSML